MFSTPRTLVQHTAQIASPPRVFHRINDAVNNPESTTDEIARLISEDAGLTVRLLRIVNSAYFGFSNKVDSLNQAVAAIGTLQLRDLVLATTVIDKFDGLPDDLIDMDSFWCHSLAAGIATRALASARNELLPEIYFLGGMLHDVGRLVIFTGMPEAAAKILNRCQTTGEMMHLVEKEILGYNHAQVGAELLDSWGLSAELQEAAGCHHLPQLAVKHPMLTSLVHLGDVFAHALNYGNSGTSVVPKISEFAWGKFGMLETVIPGVAQSIDIQFQSMIHAFDLPSSKSE